jgi:hypothetical protein
VCSRHHARWLRVLPEAVGDADLVVLHRSARHPSDGTSKYS